MPTVRHTLGNLASYRAHVVPAAQSAYVDPAGSKHRQNIHDILHTLLVHGTCTTWDMAKIKTGGAQIRRQDRIYRRLLTGRTDHSKHSEGILRLGLIVIDGDPPRQKRYKQYRLSLYGILYCLYVLDPSESDIDRMAAIHAGRLPRIFGMWDMLKSRLGRDAYNLRILARGILLDNVTSDADNPVYGLLSFIGAKYWRNFDYMPEEDLAEQISYWFYTFLLYGDDGTKLRRVLRSDRDLKTWYAGFFREAKSHHSRRFHAINRVEI